VPFACAKSTRDPTSTGPTRSSPTLASIRPSRWFAATTSRHGRRSSRQRPTAREIAGTARSQSFSPPSEQGALTIGRAPLSAEALATSVPLFLLLFASSYVVMAAMSAGNFGERLTHTDGLYFTVTVFSTVGFGDITPKTQAARLVVTGQMIANLVILGLAIKIIVGAVSRRRQQGDTR
jgi:hypothetical protein